MLHRSFNDYPCCRINEQLLKARTAKGVLDIMQGELRKIGVEYFCLLRFARHDQEMDDVILGARMPTEWLATYRDKSRIRIDPGLRYSKRCTQPFLWYDAPLDPRLKDQQALMVKEARSMGIPEALVVPIPGPRGNIGAGWFGSSISSREALTSLRYFIQALAFGGFFRLQELLIPPLPAQNCLSKRESEILVGVSNGLSSAQIAKKMHLSPRTVEWYIAQAAKKLGAKNRIQTVVLALQQGVI